MTGAHSHGLRSRFSILYKLLIAFMLPTCVLFAGFAYIAHEVLRRDLEAELGTRLAAVASSASTQLRGKYLDSLGAGDEGELFYQNARRKLVELKAATGVERLYVIDRTLATRVDTDDNVAIGATHFQAGLDRVELERVFTRGARVSSVLFRGDDDRFYKAGYAPVFMDPSSDKRVALAVGVDAPAVFFERLSELRGSLLLYGALLALAVALVAVAFAFLLIRPLRRLADSATRIGRGDLDAPIHKSSSDEIGVLAGTMEQMRTDLKRRDERLQMMLSGIAHEVRNPLGGMELFAGILREELAEEPSRLVHLEKIERELAYLDEVVNEFLDYARRPALKTTRVDLGELSKEVCELEAARAAGSGVKIRCDVEQAEGLGDEGQLRRVLLNLVRNAAQAAQGQGDSVRVSASATGLVARVEVKNSGQGLSPEVRERLFDPFFTTKEKGTGLGLALARDIIHDHGGAIEVESEGGQTTFSVEIPVLPPEVP